MPTNKPFIGLYIMENEDELLQTLASEHKIAKTKLARALMRAGLQVFEQNPKQVLVSADLRGIYKEDNGNQTLAEPIIES